MLKQSDINKTLNKVLKFKKMNLKKFIVFYCYKYYFSY